MQFNAVFRKLKATALEELKKSFHEEKTPHQIALSFSIGVFVTVLPTLGLGLLLFAYMARSYSWVSRLAIFSSAFIFNPLIKPFFYLASINIGGLIIDGKLSIPTEPEPLLVYLLIGSLATASVLAVIGYWLALGAVKKYREKGLEFADDIEEVIEEDLERVLEE